MPNINQIAKSAKENADKLGIKKFDIYGSAIDETSVQVDQGQPKQVKASNRSGVTVRVWNENNTMGVTSTTDVDAKGLELALNTAYGSQFFWCQGKCPRLQSRGYYSHCQYTPRKSSPSSQFPNL